MLEQSKGHIKGRLPDFLVIGAQKCGTSWLAEMIARHPEAFVASREVHYFNKVDRYEKGKEWYRSFFPEERGERVVGEATPNYFWTFPESETAPDYRMVGVPRLVNELIPDVKLILLLRNPVDRAISAYYHHIRAGRASPNQRIGDVKDRWGITSMGYYDDHLRRWRDYFSDGQLQVHIFEEAVLENRHQTIRRTYRFLGLDPSYTPENIHQKQNARSSHAFLRLKNFSPLLAWVAPRRVLQSDILQRLAHIPVSHEERKSLRREYSSHIKRLENLLDRSLPW